MIWLYIFMPLVILAGLAFYFDKKSGASSVDTGRISEKLEENPEKGNGTGSF